MKQGWIYLLKVPGTFRLKVTTHFRDTVLYPEIGANCIFLRHMPLLPL